MLDEGGAALEARVPTLREFASTRAVELERETPPMRKRMNRGFFALGVPVLALYQVLRAQGVAHDSALGEIEALLRAAYAVRLSSPAMRAFAGRMFRLPIVRNAIAGAAERAREPGGFVMRRVESDDPNTLLALDVEHCPLAELFARHEVPELGPLICMIDDLMAAALPGVELERTGTIAGGASRCDFRYRRVD